MTDILKEELQDALAELKRSRERERKLAEENEAILSAISALRSADNRHQIFNALIGVLQKYIYFNDALVLSKNRQDKSFDTLQSTNPAYVSNTWPQNAKFDRALLGECILLYKPVKLALFSKLSSTLKGDINSALICGFSSEVTQSIIILVAKDKGQLNPDSKSTLTRLMPLVGRALQDIEQKDKLRLMVNNRTKELANNRKRFIDFAQSVGDWLWETDTELNFSYQTATTNCAILRLKGNLLDALSDIDSGPGNQSVTHAINKLERFIEIEIATDDGFYISISGKPYFNSEGEYLGYRGSAKDVTSNRRQVKALKVAQDDAIKANNAKSEFLAVMSHEIRTPLNTVLGLLDIIREGEHSEKQNDALTRMESSAELLFVLISDILDLSKIESGHFRLDSRPVNLFEMVRNSIDHHVPHANNKGINIELDIAPDVPEYINIDSTRFTQILFNLVGNAIKFTSEGKVTVIINTKSKNELLVEVIDTGIGIPEETIGKLFDAFQQADSSITRQFGGTGLGLAIAKRLVELMGGNIRVRSTWGEGSHFQFTLPVMAVGASSYKKSLDSMFKLPPKNILLVEDNKTNQMVIQLQFRKMGHDVTVASNGQEAVELLCKRQSHYDLIFMDLSMPVMDGFEATGVIRSHGILTPIIALTAHAMESDKQKCMQAGMSGFVTKPVRSAELIEVMGRFFELELSN